MQSEKNMLTDSPGKIAGVESYFSMRNASRHTNGKEAGSEGITCMDRGMRLRSSNWNAM